MYKIYTFLVIISLFVFSVSEAQPVNNIIKDVSMPAPGAISLGKYGDIPVGYYTGVPNVGIPLHTITDGPLSLPVSLGYHAGGLKVGEPVSWVGVGWSLQAGGLISRTIQGKADESCDGYFMSGKFIAMQNDTCVAPTGSYTYASVQSGSTDAEPDIFSFSVGGYSGKFFIEADLSNDNIINGKVVLIPKQDVRITYETSGSCGTFQLRKFTITTPDGNKYEFGNIDNDVNNKGIDVHQFNEIAGTTATAWQLRKISSADGNYSIVLNYTAEKYRYQQKTSGSGVFNVSGNYPTNTPSGGYYHHVTDVLGWRLASITNGGATSTVSFIASTSTREDLTVSPWAVGSSPEAPKALSTIKIQSGTLCKQFDLGQSYYADATTDNSGTTADKRLKLTSLQEKSCDNAITVRPYNFQYYELAGSTSFLPTRLSSAIDHWGFYNGASGNTHAGLNIPLTKLPSYSVGGNNVSPVKGGSDRETNEEKMMLGALSKISYPTGGSTSFEYEANKVYGNRETLTKTEIGTLQRSGYDCSVYTNPAGSFDLPAQTQTDITSLYYNWTVNPPAPQPSTCSEGAYLSIVLFNANTNASLGSVQKSLTSSQASLTSEGLLKDLFSHITIPTGVPLRLSIYGKSMSGSFSLQKLTSTTTNINYAVGGLRIKKVTNNDGTSTGQDVVKSYSYEKAVIPGQSSAILYNQPVYGYVFQGCLGSCNGLRNNPGTSCPGSGGQLVQTHFFFETSVVPLASFEGYHIGYSAVREYFNGTGSGYYNLYQYYNDPAQGFNGIPLVPIQPRIGSGEFESIAQRTASSADIAYDIYEKRTETNDIALGIYLKFNSYRINGDPGNTAITFWKKYPLVTRPFRYQSVTTYRDGQSSTVTKQYNGSGHLQLTNETMTNSDGKISGTQYKYPSDAGLPASQVAAFTALNLLVPVETTITVGSTIKGSRTEYGFFNNSSGNYTGNTPAGSDFIRPYRFYNYEAGWVQKGQIDSYHGTGTSTGRSGLPKQFTKTGWLAETYEWTSAGLIKQRSFKDFKWQYEYLAGTSMVSKITNPDGQFSEYLYDPLMRLQQAKARGNNVVTAYTYTYPAVNGSGIITSFGNVKATTTYSAVAGSGLGSQETFQYFDGLGRGLETVFKGKATGGKDQIVAMGYDNQGRLSKSFEPFASSASDGSYQTPGSNPFTQTEYESNALNRVWKVTPPSWASSVNTYAVNGGGDGVLNYNFSTGGSTPFGDNTLTKTTTADGNGNKSISFTDKKGRLLLSRKTNSGESSKADTYYVYDDKDRLVRVIPPGASWNDTELVFTYQYTNNDLVSQKKVPGKAYEAYEYNSRDLPVRYQDPILRANSNRWMGSKYDDYGRLTQKGVYASGSGDGIALSNTIIENIYSTATSGIEIDKLKTSKVQVFTAADPVVTPNAANGVLQTTFNYDTYGRINSTSGNNHTNLGSTTAESISYGYDNGDNILTETRSSNHSAGNTTIANSRLFDSWGRLTQTKQNLNNSGDKIISELSYTDKDQLAWKKIGNGLQQIDYGYLQNGLLSSINGTSALSGSTFPVSNMLTGFTTPTFSATTDDLFRQVLEYNTLTGGLNGTSQNSGNIGQMIWQVKGRSAQAYGFSYDYLDRLTNSRYSNYTAAGGIDPVDYYGESLNFDARGNVTSITRQGMVKNTSSYSNSTIDGQSLTLQSGSNLVTQSNGTSSVPTSHISLDAPHNHLNLPIKFDFGSNNTIELLYDGLGNKLRKTVKTSGTVTLTQDYLDGIELKNNTVEAVYNEEGRAFNNSGTFRYEFALRDHIGNTRLVFTDKNASGNIDNSEILNEIHYYPFGKAFNGSWYNDATASKYKYLYNGKELSEEFDLNFYDYGARWLDPALGSWWEVDPMAEKYFDLSPYSYVANNPIKFIDPEGLDIWINYGEGQRARYENGKLYNEDGSRYNGRDAFVSTVSKGLNKINSTEIGATILSTLSSSKNDFSFVNKTVKAENGKDIQALSYSPNESGGGTISAGFLVSNLSKRSSQEGSNVENIAHELFHAYQGENGEQGSSVNREVGAYLYGRAVSTSLGYGFSGFGSFSKEGQIYEKAMSTLMFSDKFNPSLYKTAIDNFKAGSIGNNGSAMGLYRKFKVVPNDNNPVIKRLFPLIR